MNRKDMDRYVEEMSKYTKKDLFIETRDAATYGSKRYRLMELLPHGAATTYGNPSGYKTKGEMVAYLRAWMDGHTEASIALRPYIDFAQMKADAA